MAMTAAERAKLLRERRRRGIIRVSIDVSRETRDVLTETRWLKLWDEDNKAEVQAVMQIFADNLRPAVTRDD